jgi:hypothetical protein
MQGFVKPLRSLPIVTGLARMILSWAITAFGRIARTYFCSSNASLAVAAIGTGLLTLCSPALEKGLLSGVNPAAAAEMVHDINKVAFAMPTEWLLVPKMTTNKHNDLLFRRYGMKTGIREGVTDFDPAKYKLLLLDPPGTLVNSLIFVCRRSRQETDTLTIHLPNSVGLRSFEYGDWHSKFEIRSLADGQSRRTSGEYIKGDLFLDAADMEISDFLQLLSARHVTYELGKENDRVQFIVADTFGEAIIKDFVHFAVPELMHVSASAISYFDTSGMLSACLNYKKTGKIPNLRQPLR